MLECQKCLIKTTCNKECGNLQQNKLLSNFLSLQSCPDCGNKYFKSMVYLHSMFNHFNFKCTDCNHVFRFDGNLTITRVNTELNHRNNLITESYYNILRKMRIILNNKLSEYNKYFVLYKSIIYKGGHLCSNCEYDKCSKECIFHDMDNINLMNFINLQSCLYCGGHYFKESTESRSYKLQCSNCYHTYSLAKSFPTLKLTITNGIDVSIKSPLIHITQVLDNLKTFIKLHAIGKAKTLKSVILLDAIIDKQLTQNNTGE